MSLFLAWRVTNETYRWVTDARFHPTEPKVVATKWYTSSRSLGAGEGWEYSVPADDMKEDTIKAGSGKVLVGRTLPLGWTVDDYADQQVGPEQFIWAGNDSVIYSKNTVDTNGVWEYSKGGREITRRGLDFTLSSQTFIGVHTPSSTRT